MSLPDPERFPALDRLEGFVYGFTLRVPSVDVAVDKEAALERLAPHHAAAVEELGFDRAALVTGEQVHGSEIATVGRDTERSRPLDGVDGLICAEAGLLLGIYVADCCAVFLVDRRGGGFGLVHAGKRGAELGIVPKAIGAMEAECGSRPADLLAVLSPCIRPPDYEIDFAASIREQCLDCGLAPEAVSDSGISTAAHPDRYYSYRVEKGKTGRMLALLGRRS